MNLFQSPCQRVADAILDEIKKLPGNGCYVEGYANGREQGYCLYNITHKVAFSQDRSGDDIVVYLGKWGSDFSLQGNVPSERVYRSRLIIDAGDYARAAKAIHNWLSDGKPCQGEDDSVVLHRDADKRMTVNGWTTCLYTESGHGWFWYGDSECRHNFRSRSHGLHSISPAIDELPVGVIAALQEFGIRIPDEYR